MLSFTSSLFCTAQSNVEVNFNINLSAPLALSSESRVDFIFNSQFGIGLKKFIRLNEPSTKFLSPYFSLSKFYNLYDINSISKTFNNTNLGSYSNIIESNNISIGIDYSQNISSIKNFYLVGGIGTIAHFQSSNSSTYQSIVGSDTATFFVSNFTLNKTQINYFLKLGIQQLFTIKDQKFNLSMNGSYFLNEIVLGEYTYSEEINQEKGEVFTNKFNLLLSLGYIF